MADNSNVYDTNQNSSFTNTNYDDPKYTGNKKTTAYTVNELGKLRNNNNNKTTYYDGYEESKDESSNLSSLIDPLKKSGLGPLIQRNGGRTRRQKRKITRRYKRKMRSTRRRKSTSCRRNRK